MSCGCKKKNTQSTSTQSTSTQTEQANQQLLAQAQEQVVKVAVQLREMIEKKEL